jgi:hypothetical protein
MNVDEEAGYRQWVEQQPTGKCDICNTTDAKYWYGNTASATCGSQECVYSMDERYKNHCREIDKQFEFEKEMIKAFGDPDEY